MYRLVLYFDNNAEYSSKDDPIVESLKKIKKKWNIDYDVVNSSSLSEDECQKLKTEIRSIPPQVRGKIVSSGNHILPLSRQKNLNLTNTRILLFYRYDLPINVFPHLLGMTYNTIEDHLSKILKYGPRDYADAKGLLENPIQKILSEFPSILEPNLQFIDLNVLLENGEIDILCKDDKENFVVIEIETIARDIAFSQICRLASEFSKTKDISMDKIRMAIVCIDFSQNIIKACKAAGVELYKLKIERIDNQE
ncbi:endonuclease NucS domain-containing protein [[Eubacterium] cellulosolvens]